MKRLTTYIWAAATIALAASFVPATARDQAQSPRAKVDQLVKLLQRKPDDTALREKIARAAATIVPSLAVPEDARRYFVRGQILEKQAKLPSDYDLAIQNYKKALLIAPWWSDGNYRLGMILERTQQYSDAIEALKISVLADPHGARARAAKDMTYAIEAEQEKAIADKALADRVKADMDAEAAKQQAEAAAAAAKADADKAAAATAARAAAAAEARRQQQATQLTEPFRGTWYGSSCHVGWSVPALNRGCTDKERAGVNWYVFSNVNTAMPLEFTVPGDGTVKVNSFSSWAACPDEVVGIPQGPSLADIRWQVHPKDGPVRQIYSEINAAGDSFTISCNRPLYGADSNGSYRYVWWHRQPKT
jgi:tetratricopeptide (TPR) repeat protein